MEILHINLAQTKPGLQNTIAPKELKEDKSTAQPDQVQNHASWPPPTIVSGSKPGAQPPQTDQVVIDNAAKPAAAMSGARLV